MPQSETIVGSIINVAVQVLVIEIVAQGMIQTELCRGNTGDICYSITKLNFRSISLVQTLFVITDRQTDCTKAKFTISLFT